MIVTVMEMVSVGMVGGRNKSVELITRDERRCIPTSLGGSTCIFGGLLIPPNYTRWQIKASVGDLVLYLYICCACILDGY